MNQVKTLASINRDGFKTVKEQQKLIDREFSAIKFQAAAQLKESKSQTLRLAVVEKKLEFSEIHRSKHELRDIENKMLAHFTELIAPT